MQNRIRQKVERKVALGTVDQNVWSTITTDPALQKELRDLDLSQTDDLGILRWLMEKGVEGDRFRCSFGWYIITRRGLEYMANRANVPLELIALTSAIFSTRTAVDLNILATNLWDMELDNVWVYSRFRPDIPEGNIKKFLKMRDRWNELVSRVKQKHPNIDINELAKVWTFALTRPNWKEIVEEQLPSKLPSWLTPDVEGVINELVEPITMYGKTGNYALNLLGYTGLITVDTHMFKPVFGINAVSEELVKLLHRDKELYQSFSEDYTDILEDLGNELGVGSKLGYEPSPAGLQAIVWVMRQVAGQDFTRPVSLHRFHRFKDALAEDYLRKRRRGSKSKLEHILDQLLKMYDNPKGTKNLDDAVVMKWKMALWNEWIVPLEQLQRDLDKLKAEGIPYTPHRVREPKRIFTTVEEFAKGTSLKRTPEQMIEEVHKAKTKGRSLLGDIQPILEAELPKIATQLGLPPTPVLKSIRKTKWASKIAQEAVHISPKDKGYRNRVVEVAGKRYQHTLDLILSILQGAEKQNLTVSPELFLGFSKGENPTATLHSFWRRLFPKTKLEVKPNGIVEVVLDNGQQPTIRLQLNTTATSQKGGWFLPYSNITYRIAI